MRAKQVQIRKTGKTRPRIPYGRSRVVKCQRRLPVGDVCTFCSHHKLISTQSHPVQLGLRVPFHMDQTNQHTDKKLGDNCKRESVIFVCSPTSVLLESGKPRLVATDMRNSKDVSLLLKRYVCPAAPLLTYCIIIIAPLSEIVREVRDH